MWGARPAPAAERAVTASRRAVRPAPHGGGAGGADGGGGGGGGPPPPRPGSGGVVRSGGRPEAAPLPPCAERKQARHMYIYQVYFPWSIKSTKYFLGMFSR